MKSKQLLSVTNVSFLYPSIFGRLTLVITWILLIFLLVKNTKMGLSYRNRVASFVNKMSRSPHPIEQYRSNPMHRAGPPSEAKMATFAVDLTQTRTGFAQ